MYILRDAWYVPLQFLIRKVVKMHTHSQTKTPEQMVEAIFALDLEPLKPKLMDREEGYGWSKEQVNFYEQEYKRFLAMLVRFPNETIVPTKEVDKFWHSHILDTMKYAEDCNKVFGYFLHHYPYLGMRGEEDAEHRIKSFAATQRLYQQEFGQVDSKKAAWCGAAASPEQKAAWCGAAASSEQKAAWCGATASSEQKAAWCGAAASPEQKAAWCGAAASSEQKAAWCGAALQVPA
jgi:hypothetical protein